MYKRLMRSRIREEFASRAYLLSFKFKNYLNNYFTM